MKLKVIAAAAATLAAGSAFALGPAAVPAVIVYAGGGSAQPNAFMWAANQILNNIDSYTDGACGAQSGNYRIFFGTTKNALNAAGGAAIPAGTNVLVYYKLSGGSFPNGVISQGTGSQLVYPSIATAALCPGQDPPAFGVGNVLPQYAIPAGFATSNQVPDFGLSDTEVGLFNFPDNTPSAPASTQVLTAAQLNNIKTDGIYDNIIGLAVTGTLYNSAAHPKTNFTSAEVQGILSGIFVDWSQMTDDNGAVMPAGPITFLDRSPGSGTKAAFNQFFLNYPGGIALGGDWVPGNIGFGTAGSLCDGLYDDINESSSSNLVTALQTANATGTCRAVGILGLEFPPQLNEVGGVQQYWFAKINGVDPGVNGAASSYSTEINGSYPYFFTNSFNNRTKAVGANPQHWEGDGSQNSTLITTFRTTLQSNQIAGGVAGNPLPNGVPGLLMDPVVTGAFGACTTRGTHLKNTVLPIETVDDYQLFAATPVCNDPL